MARIKPITEAWMECPRADECYCNDCSLTINRYFSDPSDPQPKCTFGKTGRLRIGLKWKLSNRGLKPRELSAVKKWESLSPDILILPMSRVLKIKQRFS